MPVILVPSAKCWPPSPQPWESCATPQAASSIKMSWNLMLIKVSKVLLDEKKCKSIPIHKLVFCLSEFICKFIWPDDPFYSLLWSGMFCWLLASFRTAVLFHPRNVWILLYPAEEGRTGSASLLPCPNPFKHHWQLVSPQWQPLLSPCSLIPPEDKNQPPQRAFTASNAVGRVCWHICKAKKYYLGTKKDMQVKEYFMLLYV